MAETIPTVSILMTDFGAFTLSKSVADKIADYPKIRYFNPFLEDDEEYEGALTVDLSHPPMRRYFRLVSEHMKREWLKG